jgi:hypothetical protein
MKEFWDRRYEEDGFAYGKKPNAFIEEQLKKIHPMGKILFPAEGEGRNAVFAAQLGWSVEAYDLSETGKRKAEIWAAEEGLNLDYRLGSFTEISYPLASFDALILCYVHMPQSMKKDFFHRHLEFMKPGALFLMEAFSTNNLSLKKENPQIGGPDQSDLLYSVLEVESLLGEYGTFKIWEETLVLNEGKYHIGTGSVIRCIGHKNP